MNRFKKWLIERLGGSVINPKETPIQEEGDSGRLMKIEVERFVSDDELANDGYNLLKHSVMSDFVNEIASRLDPVICYAPKSPFGERRIRAWIMVPEKFVKKEEGK
jgi:hypothetical protein